MRDRRFLEETVRYFEGRLREHGPGPRGMDYNGPEAQSLRFEQIARLIALDVPFSVLDYGSGSGGFYDYLSLRAGAGFSYTGYDVSARMVEEARGLHAGREGCAFTDSLEGMGPFDYVVGVSIFNNRLTIPEDEWGLHVLETLADFDRLSLRGFAFNMLTSYSDPGRMRRDLYYADPCLMFDLCKRNHSRDVALLHDYGLYDFTIIVRKRR